MTLTKNSRLQKRFEIKEAIENFNDVERLFMKFNTDNYVILTLVAEANQESLENTSIELAIRNEDGELFAKSTSKLDDNLTSNEMLQLAIIDFKEQNERGFRRVTKELSEESKDLFGYITLKM